MTPKLRQPHHWVADHNRRQFLYKLSASRLEDLARKQLRALMLENREERVRVALLDDFTRIHENHPIGNRAGIIPSLARLVIVSRTSQTISWAAPCRATFGFAPPLCLTRKEVDIIVKAAAGAIESVLRR